MSDCHQNVSTSTLPIFNKLSLYAISSLSERHEITFLLFDPFTIPVGVLKGPLKDSYRNCKRIKRHKSFFMLLANTGYLTLPLVFVIPDPMKNLFLYF